MARAPTGSTATGGLTDWTTKNWKFQIPITVAKMSGIVSAMREIAATVAPGLVSHGENPEDHESSMGSTEGPWFTTGLRAHDLHPTAPIESTPQKSTHSMLEMSTGMEHEDSLKSLQKREIEVRQRHDQFINDLKARITTLEKNKTDSEFTLRALQESNADLKEQISSQNEQWNKEREAFNNQIRNIGAESTRWRQLVEDSERERSSLETRLEGLTQLENKNRLLEDELSQRNQGSEMEQLHANFTELHRRNQELTQQWHHVQPSLSELERLKKERESLLAQVGDSEALRKEVQGAHGQAKLILAASTRLRETVGNLQREKGVLENQLGNVRKDRDLSLENQALQTRLKEMVTEMQKMRTAGQTETAPNTLRQLQRLHHQLTHSVAKGVSETDSAEKLREQQRAALKDSLDLNSTLLTMLDNALLQGSMGQGQLQEPFVRAPFVREV
jgi:hypothetical protein